MPHISLSVALATLLISSPIWAQPAQIADRVITPSAFLGIDLQGNFMADVPECLSRNDRPTTPCRVPTKRAGRFEIRGLPYLPITPGYKLFATLTNGAISQLILTGNSSSLNLVKEMLIDQLGNPVTSTTHWIKLKSGASFEAETFKWNTQGVAVDFGRNLNDLSRYSVIFSTTTVSNEISGSETTPMMKEDSL